MSGFLSYTLRIFLALCIFNFVNALAKDMNVHVDDFALLDQNGQLMQLSRQKNAKVVVLITYGVGCPIAQKNIPFVDETMKKFENHAVRFFYLDSNIQDDRRRLLEESKKYAINIPILSDDTQQVAKSLKITRTAEVILINPQDGNIIFRGPITNRFNYDADKKDLTINYLDLALTNYFENKPLNFKIEQQMGCAITFDELPPVDYTHTISPIFEKRCAKCHNTLGISPTNLWTYKDVKGWSKMISEVIRTERMPPWEVDSFYTRTTNDLSLTTEEKRQIYSWIERGSPEKVKNAQIVKYKKEPNSNKKLKVDLTLKNTNPIIVPADSKTPWYYEEVLVDAKENIWINGLDVKHSNRSNLQHVSLIITKKPMDLSKNIFQPQYLDPSNIYTIIRFSTRLTKPIFFNDNLAYLIPKGGHVYMEMHFALTGKKEANNVEFQLQLAPKKTKSVEILYRPTSVDKVFIPANSESVILSKKVTIKEDNYLIAAGPHMHWRGKSAKLILTEPGQEPRIILSTRYVFKNRAYVIFEDKILLKAGSTLEARFEFDNSSANPAKIDFNKPVGYGADAEMSEMAVMHLFRFLKKDLISNKSGKIK